MTRIWILGGLLFLVACVAPPPAQERTSDPAAVIGKTWYWLSTLTPVDRLEAIEPTRYTLLLHDSGKIELKADCNSVRGSYTIGNGMLTIGPLASTRKACPEDTIDQVWLRQLGNAAGFFVEGGYLYIDLKMDSGTMRFGLSPSVDS